MARYAEGTTVSVDRSKSEIEQLVQKYGAGQFFSGWDGAGAVIGFRMKDRNLKFTLKFPDRKHLSQDAFDRRVREHWRALVLVLKAKLVAVASGVSDFETEFLGNITIGDGRTMGEYVKPQLKELYSTGRMPPLLLSGER